MPDWIKSILEVLKLLVISVVGFYLIFWFFQAVPIVLDSVSKIGLSNPIEYFVDVQKYQQLPEYHPAKYGRWSWVIWKRIWTENGLSIGEKITFQLYEFSFGIVLMVMLFGWFKIWVYIKKIRAQKDILNQ